MDDSEVSSDCGMTDGQYRVEPVVTAVRFRQASNRLEAMRGIAGASDKLFVRMTRRFVFWNIRDGMNNYRFYDIEDPRVTGGVRCFQTRYWRTS